MVLPFVDRARRVDMRTRAFNVPPQEVQCTCKIILSILFTLFKELYFTMELPIPPKLCGWVLL